MVVGLGFDLVDVDRVRLLLARKGDHALERLFTAGEREYSMARPDPALHLAARIAAKEAAFKALAGTVEARGIGWRELEVCSTEGASPELRLHGLAERRAAELGVARVMLTLTHTATTAGAVCVLENGR